nr:CHAP domain-containing protein [Novosphingobium ovatum]
MVLTPVASQAGVLQCAPYARQVSGIQLFGAAATWWGQAAGQYGRGQTPRVGAVLAFRATGSMRSGHVATVSKVLDDRRVILNHANWSGPGMIERSAMAEDVSPNGDWTQVRVYYAPIGKLGLRASPTYGFIYGHGMPGADIALND